MERGHPAQDRRAHDRGRTRVFRHPDRRRQPGRRGRVQPGRHRARHRASASGGSSSIRLWDTATQQEIGTPMTAGPGPVYAVAFSPDGTTLASADGDGSARLWDAATQQEIGTPMTAGPGRSTRSPSARTAPRSLPPTPMTVPAATRASGTWPSRPGCWPPPAPSRINPSPASSGLTTRGPSRSSRSAARVNVALGPRLGGPLMEDVTPTQRWAFPVASRPRSRWP